MIPYILAAVGGYLIGDSIGEDIDKKIPEFAEGGKLNNESILKQGDTIYFTLDKNIEVKVYDIADADELDEDNLTELPLKIKNIDNYAVVYKQPELKKEKSTDLVLEEILDDVYVFKKMGDYNSKYVIIPKEKVKIDWEKTLKSIDRKFDNISKRKKKIKEGNFKFEIGYYDSKNRFVYKK